MTVTDLRCDICGAVVVDPAAGVRFVYHPGSAELRDDSGLTCTTCWGTTAAWLGERAWDRCAICSERVTRQGALHVRRADEPQTWKLCADHAVEFLNRLRTVEPKLDPASFRLPFLDFR